MAVDRRAFLRAVAATTAAGRVMSAEGLMSTIQPGAGLDTLKAIAFDAYGTLFDVLSVTSLCEELFPGHGAAVAQTWRAKQLQYTVLRSLMARHKDFWEVTEDGLVYVAKSLKLDLTADTRRRLMDAYLRLTAFPDVKPGLEALRARGIRLAILSNGEPKMLEAAAAHAGIDSLLDGIISVEEVKIYKPSPRVYALISPRLRVAANQIGFVSSNSWDVNGAGAAGLFTFWIQRSAAEPQEELGFPARYVVGAITDLDALIARG